MKTAILTCESWRNCYLVANKLPYPIFDVTKQIDWSFEKYILIFSNRGDEELPIEMDLFLINLKVENKLYQICELGNDFGFETPFGSAFIVKKMLKRMNWKLVKSIFSLDTVPTIDWESFNLWAKNEI